MKHGSVILWRQGHGDTTSRTQRPGWVPSPLLCTKPRVVTTDGVAKFDHNKMYSDTHALFRICSRKLKATEFQEYHILCQKPKLKLCLSFGTIQTKTNFIHFRLHNLIECSNITFILPYT